jgi:hypothetical protein
LNDVEQRANEILREAAGKESYSRWCREAGILGPSQLRKIRRHERMVDPNLMLSDDWTPSR